MLIVFQPEHIVETATRLGSRTSQTMEDISHASWDDAKLMQMARGVLTKRQVMRV